MGLAIAIEHGSFGIRAHARRADFVNDLSSGLDAKRKITMNGSAGLVFAAHGFHNGAKSFLHVLGLKQFIVGPFEVKAQDGDAPLIDEVRINFAVGVRIRNHFAAAREADLAAIRRVRSANRTSA